MFTEHTKEAAALLSGYEVALFTDFLVSKDIRYEVGEYIRCGPHDYIDKYKVMFWATDKQFNEVDAWLKTQDMVIEPCPFCGGEGKLTINTECGGHGEFYRTAKVICRACGASGKSYIIDGYYGATTTEQDSVLAWNSRVKPRPHTVDCRDEYIKE